MHGHSPSVECVDHYITVPGFIISLNGGLQNSSSAMALIHGIIEMDMFLMDGIIPLPALLILCGDRGERTLR